MVITSCKRVKMSENEVYNLAARIERWRITIKDEAPELLDRFNALHPPCPSSLEEVLNSNKSTAPQVMLHTPEYVSFLARIKHRTLCHIEAQQAIFKTARF